jgi:hypothetical protein
MQERCLGVIDVTAAAAAAPHDGFASARPSTFQCRAGTGGGVRAAFGARVLVSSSIARLTWIRVLHSRNGASLSWRGADSGGRVLIVTVDTEADDLWSRPTEYRCANVEALARFQRLCEERGVRPTYLVSHEIMADPRAVATMQGLAGDGRCEIGTHLHPFSTPPERSITRDDRYEQPFAYEYPAPLLREKLRALTSAITTAFGRRPRTIRWGRWGLAGWMVPLMEEEGYLVDTTVTPGIAWWAISGTRWWKATSYASAPLSPYFLDRDDICAAGDSAVLEIPATVVYARPWHRRVYTALSALRLGRVARAAGMTPRWLRPFPSTSASFLLAVAGAALSAGAPAVNVMLHSSELMPGGSPYARTAGDVDLTLAALDGLFAGLVGGGVASVGLEDAYWRLTGAAREEGALVAAGA